MLLFGTERVYASHLPMFHSPHDYQVLLELTLSDSAATAYRASRTAFPAEDVYTLEPEKFVLPDMIQQPRAFRATVYRGHFERGGVPIAEHVTVRISRVLHFQKLQAEGSRPATAPFLVVGNAQEQFLVHRIGARPDFDQVVAVRSADQRLRKQLSKTGLVQWEQSASPQPVTAPVTLEGSSAGRRVPLEARRSIYLEFNDLK